MGMMVMLALGAEVDWHIASSGHLEIVVITVIVRVLEYDIIVIEYCCSWHMCLCCC